MAYTLGGFVNLKEILVRPVKTNNIKQTTKLILENGTIPVMSPVGDDLIIVTKAEELPL